MLIDLHLHLDGSISLKSARELALIEGVSLPEDDGELLRQLQVSQDCRSLNDYLKKFALPCSLIQSEKSVAKAVYNLCEELKEEGYIYAEIRFAPQLSCDKGLTQEQVVRAAIEGLEKSDFCGQLILCCMRSGAQNFEQNIETVELAARYLGKGVCACDLAGAEGLFPNEKYTGIFERAREFNLPFTMHSGEALGADSVRLAVEYGASRIGHGVRAVEDETVMALLKDKGIPLEICPTSNLQTCVFESYEKEPIEVFHQYGIVVTINSDNRMVSGTDVRKELQIVADTFHYTGDDVKQLLLNAAESAFVDGKTRENLKKKIMNCNVSDVLA